MKWQRGHRSKDVEDRRGRSSGAGAGVKVGGGAAILAVLAVIVGQALGVDLSGLFGSSGSSGSSGGGQGASAPAGGELAPEHDPDRELVEFVHFVIDDIQDTFARAFAAEGRDYPRAGLVLFTGATPTGCGRGEVAIGPFYCPPDRKAYIDLSFFRVLDERLGAGGDLAQAYVLAHELGHHLQTVLGTEARVRRDSARDKARANDLSVRLELQADCYAGVWAHATARRDLLEAGDLEESLNAAAAIGDDRLQRMAGQRVNPETFSHGSSAQRARWFRRGFEDGTLAACDTFAVAAP
jgi:predicted metalloprotease